MSPTDVRCYTCDAEPGEPCRSHVTGEVLSVTHYNRASAAWAASSSSLLPGADVSSPCPYCLAQAGERCVSGIDGSPVGYVHTERMRRDTEPCPAPSEGDAIAWLREELERRSILDATISRDLFSGYLEVRHSGSRYARVSELECQRRELRPSTLSCSSCRDFWTEESLLTRHHTVHGEGAESWTETVCQRCYAAGAPDAVCSGVAPSRGDSGRPICACGQTVWSDALDFDGSPICSDCAADKATEYLGLGTPAPLDQRIREAQPDDAHHCAWSTPTSDGESW